MPRGQAVVLAATALLLGALPLVVAHGDEHSGSEMDMHDAPKAPAPSNDGPKSYWSLPDHASLMYMHIALEIIAWFVVLPVGRFYAPEIVMPCADFCRCYAEHCTLTPCASLAIRIFNSQRPRPPSWSCLQPEDSRTLRE